MTTGTPYTPPVTRATFRRSLVLAAVAGTIGVVVLVALGHWAAALCGLFGLALGALNSYLVLQAVIRFAVDKPSKAAFSRAVLGRLAVITLLALACAWFLRPVGLAVFGGLALFQFLAIVSSMVPLVKEIRQK
ncbi:MAG: hypothetical protein ACT4RN_01950 [Pseudonocardia sp.]